ncbi:MAG: chorismate mutase [Clostridia bacterium]|nr:chorismate mutase [Clostridia bacterium]
MDKLQEARKIISQVDEEMAALFVRRMEAAVQVAEYKKERGLPIFDGAREKEILEKGSARVSDPRLREHYVRFLQNNMDVSKDYQRQLLEGMRVAYSGVEGAFAHIAAGEIFPSAVLTGYPNFQAAYQAVVEGRCDCAVLPLENSSAGEVGQVTDMMFDGGLFVNGVYELAVRHDLLAKAGTRREDIRRVISHPQALAQCAPYLEKHGWETQEYPNTALAARLVAQSKDKGLAAIASAKTAALYGLEVLEENIHQSGSNTTRFGVFSRTENTGLGTRLGDHFILLFTTRNQAGALAKAIEIIGRHGFNMRTLRSRPRKDLLWEYYFYVELEGDLRAEEGRVMLQELSGCCDRVRVAGSFQAHCRIGEGDAK